MKSKFFILILLIGHISLFGDIVAVPEYNFSIYPLEGWVLQDYSSSSDLSWLSSDSSIALNIISYSGDRFSTVSEMFDELTPSLNATGDCVKFEYLDRECAIGEINLKVGNIQFKGWLLLINGEDYDYYLLSFSSLENYEGSINEIQSVIDSFALLGEGELSSGPITTFLNASPTRVKSSHEILFFSQTLKVELYEYDYSTAQSVIEREADIMGNYSNSPKEFYNAWRRYYKVLYRDNYKRLDPLYSALKPYFPKGKYSDYELTELLMFWIQGFKYGRTLEQKSDLINPLEAAVKGIGDCDTRSLILGILLSKFNIDSLLLTSEKLKHAVVAVRCDGEGVKFKNDGIDYLFVELTSKSLIGEIDESRAEPELWLPIKMEYGNGY